MWIISASPDDILNINTNFHENKYEYWKVLFLIPAAFARYQSGCEESVALE